MTDQLIPWIGGKEIIFLLARMVWPEVLGWELLETEGLLRLLIIKKRMQIKPSKFLEGDWLLII